MSGLKHLALAPANVKLIEMIAGMTADKPYPDVDPLPPVRQYGANGEAPVAPEARRSDGLHEGLPSWRRGRDVGVEATVAAINEILDQIERGAASTGHLETEGLEALKTRLHAMLAFRL